MADQDSCEWEQRATWTDNDKNDFYMCKQTALIAIISAPANL